MHSVLRLPAKFRVHSSAVHNLGCSPNQFPISVHVCILQLEGSHGVLKETQCFLISELHCPYTGALKLVRIASLVLCPLIMFPIMLTGVCKVVSRNSCPLLSTHMKHDQTFWGPPTTSHSGVQQCFSNVSEELNI